MKPFTRCWSALVAACGLFGAANAGELYSNGTAPADNVVLPKPAEVQSLAAYPTKVSLKGSDDAAQLVVTATLPDGRLQDLTGDVKYTAGNIKTIGVTPAGRVIPVADGTTVLVHGGAGGVGGLVVQLARRRGARVIATASERNHDYLRSLGAEPVAYGDGLLERVRALAPDGVDAVIDTVGSDEAIDVSLALVDPGRVVSLAGYARRADGIYLIGGGGDPGTEIREAGRPEVARLLASGDLSLPIQQTYPLEDTAEAHRAGSTGHTRGKLVVLP